MKNIVNAWVLKKASDEAEQVKQIEENIEKSLKPIGDWLHQLAG
jgi:hypothetical protein